MGAVEKLIDKAIEKCIPQNASALAHRIGLTRQTVSKWRNGEAPIADERIQELARIAGEDAAAWLAAVRSELTQGETSRSWLAAASAWATRLRSFWRSWPRPSSQKLTLGSI